MGTISEILIFHLVHGIIWQWKIICECHIEESHFKDSESEYCITTLLTFSNAMQQCNKSSEPVFRGMHVVPAKAKRDRWTDRSRQTDGQSDPLVVLCLAGATKTKAGLTGQTEFVLCKDCHLANFKGDRKIPGKWMCT